MKREIVVFSLETLSDNKTGKNSRINGRFSLHTLAFQAKHGIDMPCVIKGNASPAQAAALMLDTDKNSKNNTFLPMKKEKHVSLTG